MLRDKKFQKSQMRKHTPVQLDELPLFIDYLLLLLLCSSISGENENMKSIARHDTRTIGHHLFAKRIAFNCVCCESNRCEVNALGRLIDNINNNNNVRIHNSHTAYIHTQMNALCITHTQSHGDSHITATS